MSEEAPKLKYCPFCGTNDFAHIRISGLDGEPVYQVRCQKCEAAGPASDSEAECGRDDAIYGWNDRVRFECEFRLLASLKECQSVLASIVYPDPNEQVGAAFMRCAAAEVNVRRTLNDYLDGVGL